MVGYLPAVLFSAPNVNTWGLQRDPLDTALHSTLNTVYVKHDPNQGLQHIGPRLKAISRKTLSIRKVEFPPDVFCPFVTIRV